MSFSLNIELWKPLTPTKWICCQYKNRPEFSIRLLSCDLSRKEEGETPYQHMKLNTKGPGTAGPFSSSFNVFGLHITMTS